MTTAFVSHNRLGRPISHADALSHALRLPAAPRALATLRRGAGREAKPPRRENPLVRPVFGALASSTADGTGEGGGHKEHRQLW